MCKLLQTWWEPQRTESRIPLSQHPTQLMSQSKQRKRMRCEYRNHWTRKPLILEYLHKQSHLHRHFTSVTTSSAQFAIVSIPPWPHHVIIRQTQSLGVPAATCNVYHPVTLQSLHLYTCTGNAHIIHYILDY